MESRGRDGVKVPIAFKARDFDRGVAQNSTTDKFKFDIGVLRLILHVVSREAPVSVIEGRHGRSAAEHRGRAN